MHLRLTHTTLYRYRTPSIDSHNEVRLCPLTDENQVCLSFKLTTSPRAKIFSYKEIGGLVHYFGLRGSHRCLEIEAEAEVQTLLRDPLSGLNWVASDWDYYSEESTRGRYAEFLIPSPFVPSNAAVAEMAADIRSVSGSAVATFLLTLNGHIFQNFEYDTDVTHVHSTVDEVIKLKAGVCQDFAHLMIACCRSQGIPARYVSGYLYGDREDDLRGCDAMHAWIECPMPNGRWVAFDPTNNILANDHYVRAHTGRDYNDVAPTRGLYMGAPAESLDVCLRIHRVKPLSKLSTAS